MTRQQGAFTAMLSGHIVSSHFGLADVLELRPVFPNIVTFPDFEFRISIGTSILLTTFGIGLSPTYKDKKNEI